jgi:SPP1 gp7 family putative phage head morphogenesis protein
VQRSLDIKTKDYVSDLLNWGKADEALIAAISPSLYRTIIETGKDAMIQIGQAPSTYDPFTDAIRKYMLERSTKVAVDVNDETEKQLKASLIEGIDAGEGTNQLRARIESIMGFAATVRADLIASTEIARAQSYADIQAWGQSGVVQDKEWYTAHDEHQCPFCSAMDGQVIHLEENYFDKGDVQIAEGTNRKGDKKVQTYNHSYDHVVGPPLHPRCRCTLLPVRA